MADHPLRPATDRRLGRPLPYQLANQPWAHLKAQRAFPFPDYAVLASISGRYPPLQGRFPSITHPFAARLEASLDLHVLSLPPMFALSQDQTLQLNSLICFFARN